MVDLTVKKTCPLWNVNKDCVADEDSPGLGRVSLLEMFKVNSETSASSLPVLVLNINEQSVSDDVQDVVYPRAFPAHSINPVYSISFSLN